ncbi:FAD-binding protein [Pseudomonas sp. WS 5013]|nr:FAD-binding protein [Pseudomonas sp. WS 5013]
MPVPDLCRPAGPASAGLSFPAGARGVSGDFDVLIIGSGFGGSVSALRLAEKGYRVAVLEQGREHSAADLRRAGQSMRYLLWAPALGLRGPLAQKVYRNVGVVHGVGVGGGSLVYAAVLLEPQAAFYLDPAWAALDDWQASLAAHSQRARQMLGVADNPYQGQQDHWLQRTATALGVAQSYAPVPQGIYFGPPQALPDPYFAGRGPQRSGCNRCGSCISGCPQGAKNSLDLNYLYLARQLGVQVFSETRVSHISRQGAGYRLHLRGRTHARAAQPRRAAGDPRGRRARQPGDSVRQPRPLPYLAALAGGAGRACAHQQRGDRGDPWPAWRGYQPGHHHFQPLPRGCADPHHAEPLSAQLQLHAPVHGAAGGRHTAAAARRQGRGRAAAASPALARALVHSRLVSAHLGADGDAAGGQPAGLRLPTPRVASGGFCPRVTSVGRRRLAHLPATGQPGGACLCRGQWRGGTECPAGKPGQSRSDGASAGRRGDRRFAGGGCGGCAAPGLRSPGPVCDRRQQHPGQRRRQPEPDHRRPGRAGDQPVAGAAGGLTRLSPRRGLPSWCA